MKRLLLTHLLLILSVGAYAQQKLKFTYDTAGNQIVRDRVCATCLKAVIPQEADSLQAATPEDPLQNVADFEITAYPNPVTQLLFVDWDPGSELKPQLVQLFTLNGRLLATFPLRSGQRDQEVDFGGYPPGIYLINVSFSNNEKRSFKVVKI